MPEPSAAAPRRARLTSNPPGAAVYRGQQLLGTTPLTLNVDQPQRLALAMRGFKPYYLRVPAGSGPLHATMKQDVPEWQRTRSFSRLKQIHRSGQISGRQYRLRKKHINQKLRYEIELVIRAFKRGEISRAERKMRVRALKEQYR